MIDPNCKILIVALGLIGGSYAQGLSQKGYFVGAVDIHQETIDFALERHFIQEGFITVDKRIGDYDIIILGLYPNLVLDWVKANQHYLKKGALLTDVVGVKGLFVERLQALLREDLEYIGAHPMAGRELSGIVNADASIFKNANYIVTPTSRNSQKAIEVCKDIGEILGFSQIATLSPEEHDEMIAYLSQLTHVIAIALMVCKENESFAKYSGDSFRDLTRIANINDALWSELFLNNKEALLESIDAFAEKMNELKNVIQSDDVEALRSLMKESSKRRALFQRKEK